MNNRLPNKWIIKHLSKQCTVRVNIYSLIDTVNSV